MFWDALRSTLSCSLVNNHIFFFFFYEKFKLLFKTMSKAKLAFRDNPQWNDFQLNNALSFYWQVLASLSLSVCSHQPCYFLLYRKANSLQIFFADKSMRFYTFWCFIFREVHMERLGTKPDGPEVIPRAAASFTLTNNCFEQIFPNGKLIDACVLSCIW